MGRHLAARLLDEDHDVVIVSRGPDRPELDVLDREHARFVAANVADPDSLRSAFENCDSVAHLAGINLERGDQTFGLSTSTGHGTLRERLRTVPLRGWC